MPSSRLAASVLAASVFLSASAHAQFCPLAGDEAARKIVTCKASVSLTDCRFAAQKVGCSVVRELETINAIVITVPRSRESAQKAKLMAMAQVRRVDADEKINWLLAAEAPDDFFLPEPGAFLKPLVTPKEPAAAVKPGETAELPWGILRVNAPAAWGRAQGAGVKVAVIDTGIDKSHPDLSANVAGGWNAVDAANPGDFSDDQGHGTHVSGTIAGLGIKGGVTGVAPKASLYGVKVLDKDGNGTLSDVVAGIDWAVKNKMDVINMSLGADEGSDPLQKAVQAAVKAGITVVAAAGNSSGGPLSFPGAYPESIAVSASAENDGIAQYSSVGDNVAFIAPGSNVLSCAPGGGYAKHSGTSMATPHVVGLAALAISSGARGAQAVRAAFKRAAAPLPGLGAQQQGSGMIDAAKLVGR